MPYAVNWDNGNSDCGTFPQRFATEAEAEVFAYDWARERNLEDLGMSFEHVEKCGGEGCYTAEVIEVADPEPTTENEDDMSNECEFCGNIMGLCTCRPVLLQVADALADKGCDATYEYPGYVSIAMPNGRCADFGDVNGDYDANWDDCKPNEPINFFMPKTATVPELVAAIEAWIATQLLSARAAEILKEVTEAMQPAEELHGPIDYVPLMIAIAHEANQRIQTYLANNGGVK